MATKKKKKPAKPVKDSSLHEKTLQLSSVNDYVLTSLVGYSPLKPGANHCSDYPVKMYPWQNTIIVKSKDKEALDEVVKALKGA